MRAKVLINTYSQRILAASSEAERAAVLKELHRKTRTHPHHNHIKNSVETNVNHDGLWRIINKDTQYD